MGRLTAAVIVIVALLVAPTVCAQAYAQESVPEPEIKVTASPKVSMAGFTTGTTPITIRVRVPQSPQNRSVCVEVDGTVYRSSCWETHSTDKLVKEFRYPSLSAGSYVVMGTLRWVDASDGKVKTTSSRDTFEIRGE